MAGPSQSSEFARDSLTELFAGSSNFLERLPMLRVAFARAAATCTEDLGDVSEQPPEVLFERVDSGSAGELAGDGRDDRAVAVLYAAKWNARLIAVASRASVFAMIEALLGSDGTQPPHVVDRPLTRIELGVAKVFFARLCRALEAAFAGVAPTSFVIEEIQPEADLSVMGGAHNSIALARFRLEAAGTSGAIVIAVTRAALNPLRQALGRLPEKETPPDAHWTQHIKSEVARTHVVLSAVLDERTSALGEIAGLKVGQIFELNATAHARVRIECNGERLMWCHLGKSQSKYTVRVDEFIDREQEFMDDILAG